MHSIPPRSPPRVSFRGKVERIYNSDKTLAYERIKVPKVARRHCDMDAFRQHAKFGSFANSDLFHGMINGYLRRQLGVGDYIRLDQVPDAVAVDRAGFLAAVTITIP